MIYEPRGKARQYAPLALNLYTHCGHNCSYCYCPRTLKKDKSEYFVKDAQSKDLTSLEKSVAKYQSSNKYVHLSFVGDPYDRTRKDNSPTRRALELLLKYKIPVQILTKGGVKCLEDIELFKRFGRSIRVGQSLTFFNNKKTSSYEPNAALVADRLGALNHLKLEGISTWASFEPVIDSDESVALLKIALEERLVDFYKIGAVSGMQVDIDWEAFLSAAIATLNAYDAKYYVKEELRALAPKAASALTREQTDMDAYPVPAFQLSTTGQKNERKPPHPPPRYDGTR